MLVTLVGGPAAGRVMNVDPKLDVITIDDVQPVVAPSYGVPTGDVAKLYPYRIQTWISPIPNRRSVTHMIALYDCVDPMAELLRDYAEQKAVRSKALDEGAILGLKQAYHIMRLSPDMNTAMRHVHNLSISIKEIRK